MTIIAVQGRTMVADTLAVRGGLAYPVAPGHRKIVRAPDGSLVGSAGGTVNLTLFRAWVINGMDFDKLPAFHDNSEDAQIDWLWLKKSGELWRGNCHFDAHPISINAGHAIGNNDAAVFAEGAMAAGASVEQAVKLTCERCVYVGGEIQVEHLVPPIVDVLHQPIFRTEADSWWTCALCLRRNEFSHISCSRCGYKSN